MPLKNVTVKTVVDEKFRFKAMDLNGAVFVYEDKPSIPIDIACDTWDVKTGKVLQISPPSPESTANLELGDWRESLVELNDEAFILD